MAKNYVCNGAKIECKLCTKPEGTLKVTSNEIKVQDKIFATEGDKEKTNLIFEGNCKKSTWQASPCASVIKPEKWEGVADLIVQDHKALLENSTIMCAYGGVPIKITDHLQKSEPKELQPVAAPVIGPIDEPMLYGLEWKSNKEGKSKEKTIEIADKVIEKTVVGEKIWLEACTMGILPGEKIKFELTLEQENRITELLETSATVQSNGIVFIQLKSEDSKGKSYKVKAKAIYDENTIAEAKIKIVTPPKVLVNFRPESSWKGEFGFDWLRINDTSLFGDNKYEDIISKQYTDNTYTTLERNQNKYKGKFRKDATQFKDLKEKYGSINVPWRLIDDGTGTKVPDKHIIQWLSLRKEKEATLKLIIDVDEEADYLEFDDNENFEITPKKVDIKGKRGIKKLRDVIKIKCKKEFASDQEILIKSYKEGATTGILGGKIKAWANDATKQKQKKVVFVQIKTPEIVPSKGKRKSDASTEKDRINKYLNQAFIELHPDSEIIELDLSTDTDFIQFISRQKINKRSTTDRTKKLKDFLKGKLDAKYASFFKAFYFAENGKPSSGSGNLSGYSQANADYVVVFKSANDQTAAHEFLHSFNLTHSFANSEASANAEFTYEYKKTDNLLDYSHHTDNNSKRCALWYWQWVKANNSIT